MKTRIALSMMALVLALSACSSVTAGLADSVYAVQPVAAVAEEASTTTCTQQTVSTAFTPVSAKYDSDDLEPSPSRSDTASMTLLGSSIAVEGTGIETNGTVATITSAGKYSISGMLNDGIKGRNSIAILDGTVTVNAGGDGLQSNNDEDAEKGTITIEGGTFDITAGITGHPFSAYDWPLKGLEILDNLFQLPWWGIGMEGYEV